MIQIRGIVGTSKGFISTSCIVLSVEILWLQTALIEQAEKSVHCDASATILLRLLRTVLR